MTQQVMNEIFKLDPDILTISCSISPLCLFGVINVRATCYGRSSIMKRLFSGEVWEGFTEGKLNTRSCER